VKNFSLYVYTMPIGTSTASSAKQLQRALKYSYLLAKLPQSSLGGASRRAAAVTLASKFNRAAGAFLGPRGGRRGLQRGGAGGDVDDDAAAAKKLVDEHKGHIEKLGEIAEKLAAIALIPKAASTAAAKGTNLEDFLKGLEADNISFSRAIIEYYFESSVTEDDAKAVKKADGATPRKADKDVDDIFADASLGSGTPDNLAFWKEYFGMMSPDKDVVPSYAFLKTDRAELITEAKKLATTPSIVMLQGKLQHATYTLADLNKELKLVKDELKDVVKAADGNSLTAAEHKAFLEAVMKKMAGATLVAADTDALARVMLPDDSSAFDESHLTILIDAIKTAAAADAISKLPKKTKSSVYSAKDKDSNPYSVNSDAELLAIITDLYNITQAKNKLDLEVGDLKGKLAAAESQRNALQAKLDALVGNTDTTSAEYIAITKSLQDQIDKLTKGEGVPLLSQLIKAIDDAFGKTANIALNQFQTIATVLGLPEATSPDIDVINLAINAKIVELGKAAPSGPSATEAALQAQVAALQKENAEKKALIDKLNAAKGKGKGSRSPSPPLGPIRSPSPTPGADSILDGLRDAVDLANAKLLTANAMPTSNSAQRAHKKVAVDDATTEVANAEAALRAHGSSGSSSGGAAKWSPLARLNSAARALTGGATTLRRTF
jgi:hypothetical protein